jgi:hypothetical protein
MNITIWIWNHFVHRNCKTILLLCFTEFDNTVNYTSCLNPKHSSLGRHASLTWIPILPAVEVTTY